ncbi:MAG: hypothetical protein A4E42_01609 [Methanoregulaceae archaeon PtaU1.Bin222]|nr:MAG: hypothetical protein A4E42_01609 [Methanoregulaceae archaeon PtaU1.Bin222]
MEIPQEFLEPGDSRDILTESDAVNWRKDLHRIAEVLGSDAHRMVLRGCIRVLKPWFIGHEIRVAAPDIVCSEENEGTRISMHSPPSASGLRSGQPGLNEGFGKVSLFDLVEGTKNVLLAAGPLLSQQSDQI